MLGLWAVCSLKILTFAALRHVSHLHQGFGLFDFLLEELFVFEKALRHAVLGVGGLKLRPRREQRHHHHVDVAQLELEGVARRAVEEGRNREVELALQVALLVVLLHLVGEPFEIDDRQLAGVAVV